MRHLIMCVSLAMAPMFAVAIDLSTYLDMERYDDWEFVAKDNEYTWLANKEYYAMTTTRDRSLSSPHGLPLVGDKELVIKCERHGWLDIAYRPSFINLIEGLTLQVAESGPVHKIAGAIIPFGTIEYWVDSNPRYSKEWRFGENYFHISEKEHVHVDAVIDELRAGEEITMEMEGNKDRFSLRGAASAIDRMLAMCSDVPEDDEVEVPEDDEVEVPEDDEVN